VSRGSHLLLGVKSGFTFVKSGFTTPFGVTSGVTIVTFGVTHPSVAGRPPPIRVPWCSFVVSFPPFGVPSGGTIVPSGGTIVVLVRVFVSFVFPSLPWWEVKLPNWEVRLPKTPLVVATGVPM
jgi:hypothetical protein